MGVHWKIWFLGKVHYVKDTCLLALFGGLLGKTRNHLLFEMVSFKKNLSDILVSSFHLAFA